MKTLRLVPAAALLATAFALAPLPVIAAETVKATVNGMVCAFCAQGIEKRLSKMPSAQAVYVDLKQKIVAVEAKEGQKLDGKAITAEITDAGYEVVKLETLTQTVAEVKASMKGRS